MKCIIGLGNPGDRYRSTRHNIGYRIIDAIADRNDIRVTESTESYIAGSNKEKAKDLLLVKPQTNMNASGVAALEILQAYELSASDVLVVYDDFQLPFGTLRLRPRGTDGGHNGMASIIYHLQTDEITRLRIGIGGASIPAAQNEDGMAAFVLSPFSSEEETALNEIIPRAVDSCLSWFSYGVQKTMNEFNKSFFNDSSES